MSPDPVDVSTTTTKRARGYLRWYPSAWRARYGEEFVAHLETELAARPVSFWRTTDIVAHGILARFSFQRRQRIAFRAALSFFLVTAAAVAAIGLTNYWSPETISSGDNGMVTGVGLLAQPSQVVDVAFNFSTRARVPIGITSVMVIPLQGFLAPQVVGVDFAAHASELANGRGWPIRLSKGATGQMQGSAPLVQAIGSTVTLARTNVFWLGLRAPLLHHAYAVAGLRVFYERRGVGHTMMINQSSSPDVICASSSSAGRFPPWCSRENQAAQTMAMFAATKHSTAELPSDQAQLVAQLSLSDAQAAGRGVPTLVDVRHWAAQFFPAHGPGAIRSVTGVISVGVPEWRFVIRRALSDTFVVLCTNRGRVDSGGGMIGVGVERCPVQKRA